MASKKALVSGGSRGIGRAICEMLTSCGYEVAFIYKSSDSDANDLAKKTGAYPIKADISLADDATRAAKEAIEHLGGIDLLVNNAGISLIKLLSDCSDDEISNIINTNLCGAIYLCREISKHMVRAHSGKIINIGSMWGKCGASCEVAYSSSKAALRGLTTSLAKELGPSGITVNCIEPGLISTEMNASLDAETVQAICDETPLMRMGTPEDVAELALFLASDSASFITGQCIGVDGGFAI